MDAGLLARILDYSPVTGIFVWRGAPRGGVMVGARAGSVDRKGYLIISIGRQRYVAHRLAWLYMTGSWPVDQIDHINGDKSDNRIVNLREATNSQNSANKGITLNNSSGYKGVSWDTAKKKWRAAITLNGRMRHLGYFDTPGLAHKIYCREAVKIFCEFHRPA